jgi:hypothetical protein
MTLARRDGPRSKTRRESHACAAGLSLFQPVTRYMPPVHYVWYDDLGPQVISA